ncbi:MAG: hypothetical protein Q8P35_00950 [Candidatus Yanofskybacteria bacterium]|nr:hypothetical protein [Candidatus Yanofskybacteria bacterium]
MFETFSFLIFLALSIFLVVRSADFAIFYSTKVAKSFLLPKYVLGFIVVAVIGILPEAFISVSSALKDIPSFGLGTLFGSNVADLTLIFALVVLISGRELKIESKIINNRFFYVAIIALPIIFGLNGYYSRPEGVILILAGFLFYFLILRKSGFSVDAVKESFSARDIALLVISMATLLIGAHLTVQYGVDLAQSININPVIIGMFIVALGTTLPELLFSIRAAKHQHDSLALGDILGTVVADATIVVGIMAVIKPFVFQQSIIYVTGVFMVLAISLLMYLMRSGRVLMKREVFILLVFYLVFVSAELFIGIR